MFRHRIEIEYLALPTADGKFTGQAALYWIYPAGRDARVINFDRAFDTQAEAARDAEARLPDFIKAQETAR